MSREQLRRRINGLGFDRDDAERHFAAPRRVGVITHRIDENGCEGDPCLLSVVRAARFHHPFAAQLHLRGEFRISRFEFVLHDVLRAFAGEPEKLALLADDERVAAFAEHRLLVLRDALDLPEEIGERDVDGDDPVE